MNRADRFRKNGNVLPIIVEQFLALLVGIAGTLMVSYAGEAAVSAVSLVNQLNNIFILVFTALALVSRAFAAVVIFGTVQAEANGVAQSFWSMAALSCFLFCIQRHAGSRRCKIYHVCIHYLDGDMQSDFIGSVWYCAESL